MEVDVVEVRNSDKSYFVSKFHSQVLSL